MTYRADDLTPQLMPPDAAGVAYGQGKILTWNASTGANTIQYRGSVLVDVPILNTGEAIALQAGHVVGILKAGKSYFILGRITVPGNPDFASASIAFGAIESVFATGFAIGTVEATGEKISATMDVPAWADEALVTLYADARPYNTTGGTSDFYTRGRIIPDSGSATGNIVPVKLAAGAWQQVQTITTARFVNPGAQITCSVVMWALVSTVVDPTTVATINATAIFRSVT
jgi:hypothetical protein